jgi:hypothetical protein
MRSSRATRYDRYVIRPKSSFIRFLFVPLLDHLQHRWRPFELGSHHGVLLLMRKVTTAFFISQIQLSVTALKTFGNRSADECLTIF